MIMRVSIEGTHKKLPLPFFHRFPIACCEIASHYLARNIKEHLPDIDTKIIKGYNKHKNKWHYWVLANEWHLDITADQFRKSLPPVICNKVHPFENEFEKEYILSHEIFISLSIGTAYGWSKEDGYQMVIENMKNHA
jgi:hypothetical protein